MFTRVIRDMNQNEVSASERFKFISSSSDDGIPEWYEGRLGKVDQICRDGRVIYEFFDEALNQRTIKVTDFARHCVKYTPESSQS